MKKMKIGIIGAGNIGAMAANRSSPAQKSTIWI